MMTLAGAGVGIPTTTTIAAGRGAHVPQWRETWARVAAESGIVVGEG